MSVFVQFFQRNFMILCCVVGLFLLLSTPLADRAFFALSRAVIMNTIASDEWIIQDRLKREGLDTGQDARKLAKDYRRLKNMASPKGTSSSVQHVHVVVVDTGKPLAAVSSVKNGSYVKTELDLAHMAGSALVIIADQSYVWQVKNGMSVPPARLGFEGKAPFDLQNVHKGLLAGFRVASFGTIGTVSAADFYKRNCPETRYRICHSLNVWKSFFAVDGLSIGIWHVTEPKLIRPFYDGLESASSAQSFLGTMRAVCGAKLIEGHSDFCL